MLCRKPHSKEPIKCNAIKYLMVSEMMKVFSCICFFILFRFARVMDIFRRFNSMNTEEFARKFVRFHRSFHFGMKETRHLQIMILLYSKPWFSVCLNLFVQFVERKLIAQSFRVHIFWENSFSSEKWFVWVSILPIALDFYKKNIQYKSFRQRNAFDFI